ncbi:uncharacterized protein LOC126892141 isoform X1 [Diabrotica virgifera virgifera]|uniref:Uncharacterized protein n=2 Tax=Diabrotica virgifera virgifera TaxID=50390 RepID=A0ABM5L546_DIAVI|nr:uncharacterized protein LOC126892141 isoform X1 [Diabrotica virgifera virgifera]
MLSQVYVINNFKMICLITYYFLGTSFRPADTLRAKYEMVKKNIKKKVSHNKRELFKTGGGTPDYHPIEGHEVKLLETIEISAEGLHSRKDSDIDLPPINIGSRNENDIIFIVEENKENIEDGEFSEELQHKAKKTKKVLDDSNVINTLKKTEGVSDDLYLNPKPGPSRTKAERESDNLYLNPKPGPSRTEAESEIVTPRRWCPESLKKKNPFKGNKETKTTQVDNVLEARTKLINSERSHVRNEEIRAKLKHEKYMEAAERKKAMEEEKHKKEIQLLDLQIAMCKKKLNIE